MTNASEPQEPNTVTAEDSPSPLPVTESSNAMQYFYNLQKELLITTLALTGIIFVCVWIFNTLNIALNYAIGACAGVVYLRMLAKDVERLSQEQKRLSKGRFALFIGLIIVASQWDRLQIIPIFLGFLTYKATLLYIMVRSLVPTKSQ